MKKPIFLCLLALLASGCTQTFVTLAPQSHFDFPNSNVYPLGHVEGQASKSSFFVPPDEPSSLSYEAIDNALKKQPGADMLINAFHFRDITLIPLPFISLYTITYRVEGTAAKMTAGTKALH